MRITIKSLFFPIVILGWGVLILETSPILAGDTIAVSPDSTLNELRFIGTSEKCFLYDGPSERFQTKRFIKAGTVVPVLATFHFWIYVSLKDGSPLWVKQQDGQISGEMRKEAGGKVVKKNETENNTQMKKIWTLAAQFSERIEEEHTYINAVQQEIQKLIYAIQDVGDFLLYPVFKKSVKEGFVIEVQDFLFERENQVRLYQQQAENLNSPLLDAFGVFRQVVLTKPEYKLMDVLFSENRERVNVIVNLKRKINEEWKKLNQYVEKLYQVCHVIPHATGESKGFEDEFIRILYSNLGRSSEFLVERMAMLKDSLTETATQKDLNSMAILDFKRAVDRFNNNEFEMSGSTFGLLANRYWKKIDTGAIHYYLGACQYALDKLDLAEMAFSRILPASNYYMQGLLGLQRIQFRQDKFSKSLETFEQVENMHPGKEIIDQAIYIAGQCHLALSNYDAVLKLSEQIEQSSPFFPFVLFLVGQAYTAKGDLEISRSIFKKISELEPRNAVQKENIAKARLNWGHVLFEMKDYNQARKVYLSLLQDGEKFSESMMGMAWCYLMEKDYENAELALKKLINQAPTETKAGEGFLILANRYVTRAEEEFETRLKMEDERKRLVQKSEKIVKSLQKLNQQMQETNSKNEKKEFESKINQLTTLQNKINVMLKDVFPSQTLEFSKISSLYEKAIYICDIIIENYKTGEYSGVDIQGEKQSLVLRIEEFLRKIRSHDQSLQMGLKKFESEEMKRVQDKRESFKRYIQEAAVTKTNGLFMLHNLKKQKSKREILALNERLKQLQIQLPKNEGREDIAKNIDQQIQLLEQQRAALVQHFDIERVKSYWTIIQWGESLIREYPQIKNVGVVQYVLGELYYEFAGDRYSLLQNRYEKAFENFQRQLVLYENKKIPQKPLEPGEPRIDYSDAIHYFRNVDAQRDTAVGDAALYGLGFCYFESGQLDSAELFLRRLIEWFPQSHYAPQSYMVIGEHYFDNNQLEKAIQTFKKILDFSESDYYEEALYKLGWSYYRLSDYPKAISTFKYLLDDNERMAKLNSTAGGKIKNILTSEAMDYIAISFSESDTSWAGGLKKAKQFIRETGIQGDEAASILHRLGDKFYEQGSDKRKEASAVYEDIFKNYPSYPRLPLIYVRVADLYERDQDLPNMLRQKQEIFRVFNSKDGSWSKLSKDSISIQLGDSIAENGIYDVALYHHAEASTQQGPASNDEFQKASKAYKLYLNYFEVKERSYDVRYNLAEISFKLRDYSEAIQQYLAVSQDTRSQKYKESAAWNAIVAAQENLKNEGRPKKRAAIPHREEMLLTILANLGIVSQEFVLDNLRIPQTFKQLIEQIKKVEIKQSVFDSLIETYAVFNKAGNEALSPQAKTDELKIILISAIHDFVKSTNN